MGGRIGYSAATGIIVIVLSFFGVIALISSLIPLVAISPILLYIGMLIGAQAFQESPKAHAPAIILALTPHLAAWGKLLIDNSLGAAGTSAAAIGAEKLGQVGVLYQGLAVMGGGAILAGLILGAIAAYTIDRAFRKAAGFAFAGAVLSFFGFMHGEAIGVGQAPLVALSYAVVSLILFTCAWASLRATPMARPAAAPETASLAGTAD
jgi:AGZA family xanthine/uracil permease-like MFS transporter